MRSNAVGIQIFWWGEVILSMRVLLFTLPVLLHKWTVGSLSTSDVSDSFILVISLCACLYLFVGLLGVLGNRKWKLFHFIAAFTVFILSACFLYKLNAANSLVVTGYFVPSILAVISVILANVLKTNV